MIRTNAEYVDAIRRLEKDREFISEQMEQLRAAGLSDTQAERASQPAVVFHEQLKEEVETYERMRRGDLRVIEDLSHIGEILIGLRIAADISQAELARRLGVNESMISRDERNEYHGISVERAQRIVDALRGRITVSVEREMYDAGVLAVPG